MSAEERSSIDDIIDLYRRDVDVSLIVQNLQRSVEERLEALMQLESFVEELRRAGRSAGLLRGHRGARDGPVTEARARADVTGRSPSTDPTAS
jgi:hypothetical protein